MFSWPFKAMKRYSYTIACLLGRPDVALLLKVDFLCVNSIHSRNDAE